MRRSVECMFFGTQSRSAQRPLRLSQRTTSPLPRRRFLQPERADYSLARLSRRCLFPPCTVPLSVGKALERLPASHHHSRPISPSQLCPTARSLRLAREVSCRALASIEGERHSHQARQARGLVHEVYMIYMQLSSMISDPNEHSRSFACLRPMRFVAAALQLPASAGGVQQLGLARPLWHRFRAPSALA